MALTFGKNKWRTITLEKGETFPATKPLWAIWVS